MSTPVVFNNSIVRSMSNAYSLLVSRAVEQVLTKLSSVLSLCIFVMFTLIIANYNLLFLSSILATYHDISFTYTKLLLSWVAYWLDSECIISARVFPHITLVTIFYDNLFYLIIYTMVAMPGIGYSYMFKVTNQTIMLLYIYYITCKLLLCLISLCILNLLNQNYTDFYHLPSSIILILIYLWSYIIYYLCYFAVKYCCQLCLVLKK